MEINITKLFNSICPSDFSASCAEIGQNATSDTWQASQEESEEYLYILDTTEKRTAFIDHMCNIGFSESEDMQSWPLSDLIALFIQLVSGDIREAMPDFGDNTECFNWQEYEQLAHDGQCSSNIFKGVDNEIYYYLGY